MAGIHHVSFTISPAPGVLNDFIAVIYNSLNTAAEVDRLPIPYPHSAPVNLQFNNLNPGIYLVEVHDTPGAGVLGNLRHDFWVDARTNLIMFERRFYRVDGGGTYDPLNGTDNITDPYFDNKTISGLFQEGYRYLKPTDEWRQDPGGVLQFLNDLNTAAPINNTTNQVWTVEITYVIASSGGASGDEFTDILEITADTSLGSTEYGKVLMATGSSTTLTFTAPFIGSIPDKTGFYIAHNGGTPINVKFVLRTGEVVRFRGADVNYILLAKGEFIKVIKKGSKLYVVDYRGQWDRIGEMVSGELQLDNSLPHNGVQYDGNEYIRIYEWIANVLPMGQKTTIADWTADATKKGLYAIDTVANLFIVPDRRNQAVRFLKNIGGADTLRPINVPGGMQVDQVGAHTVPLNKGNGYTGGGASPNWFAPGDPAHSHGVDNVIVNAGKETIMKNIGALPLLLI